jgi:hypothetical protein
MTFRTAGTLLSVLLAACGGGGGGSAAPVAFRVTQMSPPDASSDVPLTSEVDLVFTNPVDPASLDRESLSIRTAAGDEVPGDRVVSALSPAIVRFLPRAPYAPLSSHTVRVTTRVRDLGGRPLDREYVFTFQAEAEGPDLPLQEQVEDRARLAIGRWFHRMTLLPSSRFLVVGGYTAAGTTTSSAENLIPALDDSFLVPDGPLERRAAHVQVLLKDGRVLVAGGESDDSPFTPLRSCEIFDPSSFRFVAAAPMHQARSFAAGAVLADGRVLVTGGQGTDAQGGFVVRADAEIYDPAADAWTPVAAPMVRARSTHFAVALPDGGLLVLGGTPQSASAERWSLGTLLFRDAPGAPHAHTFGAATILPDGRPFLAGGLDVLGVTLWDPAFGFLNGLNTMFDERVFATATAFPDGRVLVVGGMDVQASLVLDTIDVFVEEGFSGRIYRAPDVTLPVPTSHHAAALGADGDVWITGGIPTDLSTQGGVRNVTVIRAKR